MADSVDHEKRNIKQQLDMIKGRISDPDFLSNKGLANEVGIHVFTYAPEEEILVRSAIERLVGSPSSGYRIVECDLYQIFLEILEEKRILERVADLEEKKGKDFLLTQLQKIATPETFLKKMNYEPHQPGDVLFLTGVGKAYPFIRAHIMLENLQHVFADIPIVMFYPGEFNGQSLSLFNHFHDGNYYRAFNLI